MDEFWPRRAGTVEERLRLLEEWATTAGRTSINPAVVSQSRSSVSPRIISDTIGGVGGGGGISLPILESDVVFDPSSGHYHDGDDSRPIHSVLVELDFGSIPTRSKVFTITDAIVIPGMEIFMVQSADAPTGRAQDENEMDSFLCRAVAGTGQLTAYISALEGPVVGLYKFLYHLTDPT